MSTSLEHSRRWMVEPISNITGMCTNKSVRVNGNTTQSICSSSQQHGRLQQARGTQLIILPQKRITIRQMRQLTANRSSHNNQSRLFKTLYPSIKLLWHGTHETTRKHIDLMCKCTKHDVLMCKCTKQLHKIWWDTTQQSMNATAKEFCITNKQMQQSTSWYTKLTLQCYLWINRGIFLVHNLLFETRLTTN